MSPQEILCQLIATASVNPMRALSSDEEASNDIFYEHRISDWLVRFFDSLGAPCERIEVSPGRDNVIARYDSSSQAATLLLDAHQDTVPVEGMTIPPFEPSISNGRIYGRGAADVKGGLAAMLVAFGRLFHERPRGAANVVLSCTVDEEANATGVRELVTYWSPSNSRSRLLDSAPSAAIVAEPTELDVVVAHRGVLRFCVQTVGRACHSSQPEQGRNAIYKMAEVVQRLQASAVTLQQESTPHPLCGRSTLSVGRIDGGTAVNIVPDQCVIEVDRRLIPGEDADAVWRGLRDQLELFGQDVHCQNPWISSPPLSDACNNEIASQLIQSIGTVVEDRKTVGVPYCTNASTIGSAGVPSVVFGPGAIEQAHTRDEFIEISQLEAAAEVYYHICTSFRTHS